MFRWKLATFLSALLPLVLSGILGHLEPLKDLILQSADVRIVINENKAAREQTIGIKNYGSNETDPVIVQVDLPNCAFSDALLTRVPGGPADSLINTITEADLAAVLVATGARKDQLSHLLDVHSRTHALYEFQILLSNAIEHKMADIQPANGHTPVAFTTETHTALMDQCPDKTDANDARKCKMETLRETVEEAFTALHTTITRRWRESTGVSPTFTIYPTVPQQLTFEIPTPPHKAKFLTLRYGSNSEPVLLQIKRPMKHSTIVTDQHHLDSSSVFILMRYHTVAILSACAAVILSILIGGTLFTSPDKQPVDKIYGRLLKAATPDDDPLWDIAYAKTRDLLFDDFQHACVLFRKVNAVSAHELFVYFRNRLRYDYAVNHRLPTGRRDFDLAVRHYMRILASAAPDKERDKTIGADAAPGTIVADA